MPIITNPRDLLRLQIGDTSLIAGAMLFTDDELDTILAGQPVIKLAAAEACEILAVRLAGDYDFAFTAQQQFKRSQASEAYAKRAQMLRGLAQGLGVIPVVKQDGYSSDLSTRDGAGQASRTGRVRAGYTDPDIPI